MSNRSYDKLIVIVSSTGGPNALSRIIPDLKEDLDAPVVVIQHMPKGFTNSLAKRLNLISKTEVSEAYHDHVLEKGHVYIARGGTHLKIMQNRNGELIFCEDDSEPVNGLKPYGNITLDSLVNLNISSIFFVILTGMGSDGFLGLKALKESHQVYTIAQSKETCVVYGMPKVIVENDLADNVLPLELISKEINNKVGVF